MSGQLTQHPSVQDSMIPTSLDLFQRLFSRVPKPFAVRLWDGSTWRHGNDPPLFTLEIKHPSALRRMFWRPTELSLGEAFIFDDFDIHGDIEASFVLADHLLARNWRITEKLGLACKLLRLPVNQPTGNRRGSAALRGRAHSRARDAQAIQYHYNVSNEFYRLWLDQRMVYSCALFHRPDESLDGGQYRKLDYICRKLRLKPGEKLLDIGCGWGGLVIHAAANYGVDAQGITLSQPQADLANERIRNAGLSDRCRVEVCDYRDVPSKQGFDKLVSVGMFEHVGKTKLPAYFRKAYQLLNPGGVFLNHGITEVAGRTQPDKPSFIDKYVFPDGELESLNTSLRVAEEMGFEIRDVESLREHYALTLRQWVRRLEEHREQVIDLTCPITYRIWRIYMAGSAHGFETGKLGLYQTLLVKSGKQSSGLPLTRCDWYRPCPNGYH
ncbi:MAG: cyclopropane-fatty-acyl-phospholipid synthase family protein [Trichloromonas sp.]|jgi:cyclopropane-fatty-acyl-phospholipid synthase|nr:cyclopropane-fatty-acyl-phospholipid synthase family protein [Trichloromonas sp.]